ncbi:MAG: winged helix-turn-helix domain-containing protein [Candidatus Micrarchaeales archaeon]|jgi:Predicted transcriptional regulators|uniref:Transcriptional regulator, ArsR family n=1 Tax=Candidatus Micrarchaeum acidiphilum ARMAN-2 TaxID=425595 RepID=C7DHI6_MICA2|nr:MAG: transcriptional regulator, ArsR family [Candidatus Micrarchaeum acidiphilum ARMAN-2]MCW6160657.1 winged helix-turn-helix domain-containing protein [Candidatus Micrarchaeales archaeon]
MSGTLDTKKKIVSMLRKKSMNITEISRDLGLSKATISQHISELEAMGVVEVINNPHYRKVKYYRVSSPLGNNAEIANAGQQSSIAKILVPAVFAIALLVLFAFAVANESGKSGVPVPSPGVASACPVILAYNSTNRANMSAVDSIIYGIASGSPCSLPYATGKSIGGWNYTSYNGSVYVRGLKIVYTLNQTQKEHLISQIDDGYCFETKSLAFFGINYTVPKGVSCKVSVFS